MTGYEYLKKLSIEQISENLGISLDEARKVQILTLEELAHHDDVCPQALIPGAGYPCYKTSKAGVCTNCTRRFLNGEIGETNYN